MLGLLEPEVPVPIERGRSPSVQVVRMNLRGLTGVDNLRAQATDGIKVLDSPPDNVPPKAHCKFYYLVSSFCALVVALLTPL
jgi:hypothetical protein